ncbi:MAG TPA: ATP-binding protein [Mycobacteriales bacterium]|nr:ATP-binding protein [Mycobacteriales bacterium]
MGRVRSQVDAAYILPAAFAALLVLGATTAALNGRIGPTTLLVAASVITLLASVVSAIPAAPLVAAMAWLTAIGFSHAPYGQLHASGRHALTALVALADCAVVGVMLGGAVRRVGRARGQIEWSVFDDIESLGDHSIVSEAPIPAVRLRDLAVAVSRRRQVAAVLFGSIVLPLMTASLAAVRPHLSLDDDLLLYLIAVLAITLIGGFWPAVGGAIAASLLVNWYFTPPLHNWTIDSPQNLFALLLFITVAVTVSSVVHLAARRAALARRSSKESATLLALARTVLGGDDTAADVINHLSQHEEVGAELHELVSGRWILLTSAGDAAGASSTSRIRDDLRLRLFGPRVARLSARTVEGYGAQAAAALDRERLRVQAAQAEMLAAGNRMRTALLTAVSHDLRTPLASVKASVSSLRQTDVTWSPRDEAELLATIEESADRLDALIANLLDMSRVHTGSLQPLLRPISIDEIAPLAVHGLDAAQVEFDIPDDLPLVATDPGLLERAVANLVGNAVRYCPPGQPARLVARRDRDWVSLDIVDHGPGVPDAMKSRMFEPFQQLGDQRNTEGVGLGLAVARGFVEAMGGTLQALDTPGGGLTMRLTLRIAVAPSEVSVDQ